MGTHRFPPTRPAVVPQVASPAGPASSHTGRELSTAAPQPAPKPASAAGVAELVIPDLCAPSVCNAEALDRLTRTAARVLGVRRTALSIVDGDRLWIVSAAGMPSGDVVPGDAGVCRTCAVSGEALAIRDISEDPVHSRLPLPGQLGIRGYLGAPVVLTEEPSLGVLCALDDRPREWSEDDRAAILDLAAVAADVIRAGRLAVARAAAVARARASEERFRDISESAGEYLWEVDGEGRFTFLTDPAEDVYGRPLAEMIGMRPWDMFRVPEEAARVQEWFEGVCRDRTPFRDLVRRSVRPDGEERWIRLSGSPMFGESGALLGYRGAGLNITAERKAEQAAAKADAQKAWAEAAAESARRDRHDLLERFITQAPASVAMFDRSMRYVTHSRQWLEVHGLPTTLNLVGRSHYDVFPDQPPRWRTVHDECLAGETRRAEADAFTRSDGAPGWLDWHVEPWTDEFGGVGGIVILCSDVTARQCGLSRLQSAMDAADVGTWLWDLRTGVLLADSGLRAFFGFPPEAETVGIEPDRLYDPIHPDDQGRVASGIHRAYETGRFDTEFRVRPPGGPTRWVAARGKVTRDEDDRPLSFHGAVVDITARKQTEEQLRDAKQAAEASDRAKSEFLANMSHELRTPLTAILGFADLSAEAADSAAEAADSAADGPSPTAFGEAREEIVGHARTIRRNGEHLLRLINDVLDLAKIEAGKLEMDRVPFPVGHLVGELAELMRPKAEASGLTLELDLAPELIDRAVMGDPTRVRQVLLNLLGNAVKFTGGESGGVKSGGGAVSLSVVPVAGPDGGRTRGGGLHDWLEFTVSDNGCGIPADQLERLFDPFEQADASTTRKYGGTGLGLSISRRLAERMGGTLSAESVLGQGSTFRLRVPAPKCRTNPTVAELALPSAPRPLDRPPTDRAEATLEPSSPPKPLVGRRVLLAEDIEDSRRLITFLLQKAGAEVEAVCDGRAAVDALLPPADAPRTAGGPDDRSNGFDVVLMDMQMPVLDGYDATRELRDRGYQGPVVALTAHAMDGDAAECLAAGCDAYATKPIAREALVNCVLRAVAGRFPSPAPGLGTLPDHVLEPADL